MPENYASASEIVRNVEQLGGYEVLETHGRFRIVQLPAPYFEGSELWIVNEKGFLWEPVASLDDAYRYLESDEAAAYQDSASESG